MIALCKNPLLVQLKNPNVSTKWYLLDTSSCQHGARRFMAQFTDAHLNNKLTLTLRSLTDRLHCHWRTEHSSTPASPNPFCATTSCVWRQSQRWPEPPRSHHLAAPPPHKARPDQCQVIIGSPRLINCQSPSSSVTSLTLSRGPTSDAPLCVLQLPVTLGFTEENCSGPIETELYC